MNCHHLIYKPIVSKSPYEQYIKKYRSKETVQKKELLYGQILKFKSSRYPRQFVEFLETEINPFEHSLESLKQIILLKHPEYPEDVINESVEYVFNKKSREAIMMRESATIIEDGDEFIRNGRRLLKEDFTYSFEKFPYEGNRQSPPKRKDTLSDLSFISRSGSITKRENFGNSPDQRRNSPERRRDSQAQNPNTERNKNTSNYGDPYIRNELFNKMIAEELKNENLRYGNADIIYEGDPDDILIREELMKKQAGFTDRSARSGLNNSQFPHFKEKDVIIPLQGMETGRSDLEELDFLLSEVSMIRDERGSTSRRSRGTPHSVRINRENMDNLYNIQGNLKLDVIKRAVDRMKRSEEL